MGEKPAPRASTFEKNTPSFRASTHRTTSRKGRASPTCLHYEQPPERHYRDVTSGPGFAHSLRQCGVPKREASGERDTWQQITKTNHPEGNWKNYPGAEPHESCTRGDTAEFWNIDLDIICYGHIISIFTSSLRKKAFNRTRGVPNILVTNTSTAPQVFQRNSQPSAFTNTEFQGGAASTKQVPPAWQVDIV